MHLNNLYFVKIICLFFFIYFSLYILQKKSKEEKLIKFQYNIE